MKHKMIFIFGFLFAVFGTETFAQNIRATLEISNIPLKDGTLMIAWYDNPDDFGKGETGKMIYSQKVSIKTQSASTILLDNTKVGEYAIKLFFDENGNGKIDTNFMGIPKEAYGFSNNVYPAMRGANYEEAKFRFSAQNTVIKIRMKQ